MYDRHIYLHTLGQFSWFSFHVGFFKYLSSHGNPIGIVVQKFGSFTPVTLIFELCEGQISSLRGAPVPPGSVLTAGPRVSWMGHEWIDDGC